MSTKKQTKLETATGRIGKDVSILKNNINMMSSIIIPRMVT